MKQILFTFLCVGFLSQNWAQSGDEVLMTVDGQSVTKSEFEQIYWKNKKENTTNKEELDEYMELFVKFKLKVRAAEAEGLDTTKKFLKEFNGYKLQLQKPYLVDTTINEQLLQEAYYRTVNELRASHLLILCTPDAAPKDTLKAYNKTMDIYNQIQKGKLTFEQAAIRYSEDKSVKDNKGDLGFFSAFRMVYPFEDAAYRTQIGSISKPFRSQFGYHLVNPTETRKSRGKVKVAHLMVRVKPNASEEDKAKAKQKIEEIHSKLIEGSEEWHILVRDHSDDRNSVRRNGELEWVEPGRYYPEFIEAAYSIKEDGAYSEPVETPAGYHILKRIKFKPVDDVNALRNELKNKIQRDAARAKKTKSSFVNKLKKEYGFTETRVNLEEIKKAVFRGDSIQYNRWTGSELKGMDKELFSFFGQTFTQKDFRDQLVNKSAYRAGTPVMDFVEEEYNRYVSLKLVEFERTQLEKKYPAYKNLLKEYRDGILLFEINDSKVWSYAVKDTAGLKEFHKANEQDFMWKDREDVVILSTTDKKIAKKGYKLLKKGKISADSIVNYLNADSQLNVSIETGKFETSAHPVLSKVEHSKGVNKPVLLDNKYQIINLKEELPSRPKQLNEAKGAITAAYQNYLEEQWINELKAKYKVEVNKDVLYTVKEKPGK